MMRKPDRDNHSAENGARGSWRRRCATSGQGSAWATLRRYASRQLLVVAKGLLMPALPAPVPAQYTIDCSAEFPVGLPWIEGLMTFPLTSLSSVR